MILLESFNNVEQTWAKIAATDPVSDFRAVTRCRLTGDLEYEEIGPGGEIQHGELGEETSEIQAKTYGKMLAITRVDVINDDLGALKRIPQRLGRGGGLKLNTVFWTEFMDNAAFFKTGNKNYAAGAGTALSTSSLATAHQKFLDQVDADKKPVGVPLVEEQKLRLGQAYRHLPSLDTPMVNIDHHFTNSMFGTINLVRTEATATAEIIFDLLQEWEVLLDSVLATHLLTGIVTDTQSFSTPSTTPRILEVSSQLMKAGASLTEIHENYYKKREVETLHLWGRILAEMQLDDQLVWSVNTLDMRSRSHAAPDDGDGIVNLLATARQAKAAIMFTENEDGKIGISIRSRPGVDISPIAIHFGGGGHPQAAGTELLGDLCEVIPKVLIKAKDVLNAYDPK